MTTQIRLTDISGELKEAGVQRLFDAWGTDRDGWRVCAPDWLLRCGAPEPRPYVTVKNYDVYPFRWDVMWRKPEWLVLELKHAKSGGEELALAEVLHHAWHLGQKQQVESSGTPFPIPVVVVSSMKKGGAAWMRGALRYLFAMGLQRDAIRYLEASYYQTETGQRFAWLEEPFAEAYPAAPPPVIPDGWDMPSVHWLRQGESRTWIALPEGATYTPSVVPDTFALVSQADGLSEYVVYQREHGHASEPVLRIIP